MPVPDRCCRFTGWPIYLFASWKPGHVPMTGRPLGAPAVLTVFPGLELSGRPPVRGRGLYSESVSSAAVSPLSRS